MAGALEGVRVVDFGQYIAGPLAAMLLADQGAEVVRVETPGGPRMETPANRVWNRGKKSIVLDLKAPADLAAAKALVENADVVIENFRPGVMDRFGLGAAAATEANPRLIYCSMPGFASDDPRKDTPGWEGVIAAAASTVGRGDLAEPAANGSNYRPIFTAIPAHSSFAAFWTVVSVAMALNARERDGVGQIIEVPLFDATFTALGYRAQKIHSGADGVGADMRAAMGRLGGARPVAGTQLCKDGRWVYVHPGNKNITDFIRAIGVDTFTGDDIAAQVKALFLTKTALEWENIGAEVRTEVVVCRSTEDWIASEQPQNSSMLATVADDIHGTMVQPGLQVHLDHCEGEIRPASAPDADRAEVLKDLKLPARAAGRAAPPSPLAALAGKKVLDMCIVLAGPTCGRTLAEFGADVIKIERPPAEKDGVRKLPTASPHAFNIDINRGKRSLVIDLKSKAGLETFNALVRDADVVVQNFRHGVNKSLGFDYESVRTINPNIVYASLNMYGYDGPWAVRPGHEQLGQMGVGPAVRYGADGEPTLQHVGAVNDYGTGLMGAYAVALALYHRERTGQGGHVWTSLAHTAQILQSPFFYDYAQREPWDETRGQDAWGSGALQRYYATQDGWMFLGASGDQKPVLATIEGLDGFPVAGADAAIEAFLAERLAREPSAVWTARLVPARIGAHAIARLDEVMADAWVRDHGLIISREHANIGLIDQAGPPPRLSRTPVRPGVPAPATGADGRAILTEHGLDADALQAAGAVVVD